MKKFVLAILFFITISIIGCIETGTGRIPTDEQGIPNVCGCGEPDYVK